MISEPSLIPYTNLSDRVHPLSSSPSAFPMTFLNSPPSHTPSFLTEDVKTIFIVGFPDDMTEREFQNMFTFCPGFEAASLKWHAKDQDDDNIQIATLNSKKQMIGFARFRTRRQALDAVDVISGKKVDQEKGFTLKAEMAKKNLHVKRGSVAYLPSTIDTGSSTTTSGLTSPLDTKKFAFNGHFPEPFAFSPLPSDLLSPITDYKADPFAMAAAEQHPHQQQQQQPQQHQQASMHPLHPHPSHPSQQQASQQQQQGHPHQHQHHHHPNTPTTPVFHDPLFAFRSYSIDGRASGATGGGVPPPPPFVPRANSIAPTLGMSSSRVKSPLPPPLQQPSSNVQGNDDPFHYLSKSSPMPMDRINSLFDESPFFRNTNSTLNSSSNAHSIHPPSMPPQHYPLHHPLASDMASLSLQQQKNTQLPVHTVPSSSSTTTSASSSTSPASNATTAAAAVGAAPVHPLLHHHHPHHHHAAPNAVAPGASTASSSSSTTTTTANTANTTTTTTTQQATNTVNASSSSLSSTPPPLPPSSSTTLSSNASTISGSATITNNNNNNTNLADQNPPCNTLYVGNLPINTSEDELRQLFSKCNGYKRMYFRTKPQGPMCFVEFEDVQCATVIMNDLQGHALSNSIKGGIRLSFSKNPLFTKPNKNTNADARLPHQSRDFLFDPTV
ncbi:hypothetical protein BC940DRAFT_323071 [Gongronella butleri]|nr:hypothetical protein BC940DRAFT_323071 [Gongronella butleri]